MGSAETKFKNLVEEVRKLTRQQAIKKRNVSPSGSTSSDCQRFKIYQETQKMKLTVWSMTGEVDGPQGTEQSGKHGYKTGWRRGDGHFFHHTFVRTLGLRLGLNTWSGAVPRAGPARRGKIVTRRALVKAPHGLTRISLRSASKPLALH